MGVSQNVKREPTPMCTVFFGRLLTLLTIVRSHNGGSTPKRNFDLAQFDPDFVVRATWGPDWIRSVLRGGFELRKAKAKMQMGPVGRINLLV